MNSVLLFAIEGPTRLWWLSVMLIVLGAAACSDPARPMATWLGVGMILLGFWWSLSRHLQVQHFKHVAAAEDLSKCLECGYDLRGNPNARCPECGRDNKRLIARVRKVLDDPE